MIGWACCYNQLLLWFIYIGVCVYTRYILAAGLGSESTTG